MRLIHAVFFMSLAACASIGNAVALTVERAYGTVAGYLREALDWLSPEHPIITGASWEGNFAFAGQALDPALRQSMRHEAGVSRRAADRHI